MWVTPIFVWQSCFLTQNAQALYQSFEHVFRSVPNGMAIDTPWAPPLADMPKLIPSPPPPPPFPFPILVQVIEPGLGRLSGSLSQQQRERAHAYVSKNLNNINDLLLRMPRPLLLLLKTNDCLRSVDVALGQPVNTLVTTARACTRALAEQRQRQRPGARRGFSMGRGRERLGVR